MTSFNNILDAYKIKFKIFLIVRLIAIKFFNRAINRD